MTIESSQSVLSMVFQEGVSSYWGHPIKKEVFMKVKTRQTIIAYLFMAPALIMIIVFVFIPIIGSLPLMFYDYSVLGKTKFIGWDNFKRAFNDPEFWISIKNSIVFVVVVPVIQILSILLALLVNRKLKGMSIFRTLIYIPVITSMVAVSIIWGFLFDPSGVINTFLQDVGVISSPLGFLTSGSTAMLCIMFITIWQGLGYFMMLYLAGLQSVPKELEEAAIVDGANKFKTLIKIKLPLLKPYIWFCSLNSVISAVGVFDVVYVLTKGGPYNATLVMNYYSYTKAFQDFEFGYSAAIGAVQAVITSLLSIIIFMYGKKGGGMTYSE
ncbi:MAG: sugar transporter permease [Lachnospiraceae bacterium]|jgi:putative chitobiose transport system permease protein|nr:sugar transporter permease [Lachnospiraceae bacterium]